MALCHGLNQFSDHSVLHEPDPRLLEEAFLKHSAQPYQTPRYYERLDYFRARASERYGESFRAPNLLSDIADAVPQTRFLILIRDPLEYVVSAHSKNVFRKNDAFDRTRIVPLELGDNLASLPLAERIAWHWVAVNSYLLAFAENESAARVVIVRDIDSQIEGIVEHLRVRLTDREGLRVFLDSRPNRKEGAEAPEGMEQGRLALITDSVWKRAERNALS
jgi:hypothetical protein